MNLTLGSIWKSLRSNPVSSSSWESLSNIYLENDLPWHSLYAHVQFIRCAQAHGLILTDGYPEVEYGYWGGQAEQQLTLVDGWDGLESVLRRLQNQTKLEPQDWLSWLYLARCLEIGLNRTGLEAQAKVRAAVIQALALEWMPGETGHLLAQWRLRAGDPHGALAALKAVLLQSPNRHGSWLLQAQALMQTGQSTEAVVAFTKAAESRNPKFLALLADKLFINNFGSESLQVRELITALTPQIPQAWLSLAEIQAKLWQVEKAIISVERAINLNPSDALALQWLDDLKAAGYSKTQFDKNLEHFELEGIRENGRGAPRLLMQSLYQAHLSPKKVFDLHRVIGQGMVEQAASSFRLNAPQPRTLPWSQQLIRQRRLRVGYVSGDLHRQHPVNVFMLPVLQRHDHSRIEIFVYQTGTLIDEYTRMARTCTDHWREVAHLEDAALHRLIVEDQIDVLVDLAGHTATHRLAVFAMRAAPVQMSYLGYPHSTGLSCMDWMIADAVVAPPEHEHLFTEKIARVSGSVFCWSSVDNYPLPPDFGQPKTGPIVFASFNNLLKVDDTTLAVWARVLNVCLDSRLLLKSAVLADPVVQKQTIDRCKAHGIDPVRLELRGPSELSLMMQEYLEVDIALDPFPYNGGTTSLQALWMGCPLISLQGKNFVSRMGASFLLHLGRSEWLAETHDDYVQIASQLANEIRHKPWNRLEQRTKMASSQLCQIEQQTREIEQIFLNSFEAWDTRQRLINPTA